MFTRALTDAGYDCGMVGKQHLSACEGWQTEARLDDGYRVFEWAHDPIHRSPQNAYLKWLKRKYPEVYCNIFPNEGDPANAEAGNKSRDATPTNLVKPEAHFSRWVSERAIDFIQDESRSEEQPYFMIANFFDPHHPFGAPQEFRDLIDADAIPPAVRNDGEPATARTMDGEHRELRERLKYQLLNVMNQTENRPVFRLIQPPRACGNGRSRMRETLAYLWAHRGGRDVLSRTIDLAQGPLS
jgi:arylsulfatase A-like enzyme